MHADKHDHYDAIIVGTGPGGGSVAHELSLHGAKLLILEKGSAAPIQGTPLQTIAMAMIPGKSMHFTEQFLGLIHAIALGGSSIIYCANTFDPAYSMFDDHGIDLRPYVADVKDELPVSPLSDDLLGPAAVRIMDSARALGHPWEKLPKIVHQEKCRVNCDKCLMGCPYGAKWNSRMYIEDVCQDGAVLYSDAEVTRVLSNDGAAVGVAYKRQGREYTAYADSVILAAGGIGTPQVLRRSGIDQVGTDFFFDPLVFVIGEMDGLEGGKEFPMAAGMHLPETGVILTDLVLPTWLYCLFTAQVLRFDRLWAQKRSLPIMVKGRDELGGRITQRGRVRKRLEDVERQRLSAGAQIAEDILRHTGARKIYKTWYLAVHPGGTAKIGETVDSDLQTEVRNLFICDASVIPEACGIPPSLTVLALGKRLGQHLSA